MNWKYPRYRKMDLNDPVTVTLPAGVWVSFSAAYAASRWDCSSANMIANAAAEALVDPLYLQECMAAEQQVVTEAQEQLSRFMKFPYGGIPPTPEGLGEQP